MLSRNEKVFRFRDLLSWELGQSVLGVSNMVVPQVVSQLYLLPNLFLGLQKPLFY